MFTNVFTPSNRITEACRISLQGLSSIDKDIARSVCNMAATSLAKKENFKVSEEEINSIANSVARENDAAIGDFDMNYFM